MLRVLVAVDGSEGARKAVDVTARLLEEVARPDVILLHVLPGQRGLEYLSSSPELWERIQDLSAEEEEEGRQLLQRYKERLSGLPSAPELLLRRGDPAETILATAQERKVDLIVMGARGLGPVAQLILGSVSHKVLHLASCPVLIAR
ncbi:MAG: universal stress protein [Limnochordaceae bacterium]|nr:universal stress protein [Limnochordaceae bacterium]